MAMKKRRDGDEDALAFLERELGPLTIGRALASIRQSEEQSLAQFAKRLGVSAQHLSDVENGRRGVSAERAAKWAERIGHPPAVLVRLALQQQIDAAGLKLRVEIEAT